MTHYNLLPRNVFKWMCKQNEIRLTDIKNVCFIGDHKTLDKYE